MDKRIAEELEHLIAATERQADQARRSSAYMAQLTIGLLAFGLAPLVPGARRFFGALSAPSALSILAPAIAAACTSVVLFRRKGSRSPAYRASEWIESAVMYGGVLAMIFLSRTRTSVLWILPPFTACFWANAKPFAWRSTLSIIALTHTATALAFVARGDPHGAWVTAGMGVVCGATLASLARPGRAALRMEAHRNVLRAELDARALDAERERVATMLHARVGEAVQALTTELASPELVERARAVLAEVEGVSAPASSHRPTTFRQLADVLDERCAPLCTEARYVRAVVDDDGALAGESAHVIVRVAQELVRNAVVHGAAGCVSVELARAGERAVLVVRDDGAGLSAETLARATGGLANAREWLASRGGTLEQLATPIGTTLRAVVDRDHEERGADLPRL